MAIGPYLPLYFPVTLGRFNPAHNLPPFMNVNHTTKDQPVRERVCLVHVDNKPVYV